MFLFYLLVSTVGTLFLVAMILHLPVFYARVGALAMHALWSLLAAIR